MIEWETIKELLLIASFNSTICVAFIQKIKHCFHGSKCIPCYSFAINIVLAILFCISFTKVTFPMSLWTGFFSYIGADTIYKSLEGKLKKYTDLISNSAQEASGISEEKEDVEVLEEIVYE